MQNVLERSSLLTSRPTALGSPIDPLQPYQAVRGGLRRTYVIVRTRPGEDQLDRVPSAQQRKKVVSAGFAGTDGGDAPLGGEQVRDR